MHLCTPPHKLTKMWFFMQLGIMKHRVWKSGFSPHFQKWQNHTYFKFYKFQFLNFYKNVMSKNLPQVPQMPQMCPKHGNLRCQLSIVLSVDCPEICPESQNMCPKHGNIRCRMKCAPRLPQKIKICPKTAPRLPQGHILPWAWKSSGVDWWWLDIFLLILVK